MTEARGTDADTARRNPAGPNSRSQIGLDLLNFFVANLQTGFGPFIAVYLSAHRWTETEIGLALSVGTIASIASQLPGGWLVDVLAGKRVAAAAATLSLTFCALILSFYPVALPVVVAEVLHGFASSMLGPAIAAISLMLVGAEALGTRLGRNARFGSIGNGLAAAAMGAVGTYISNQAVFLLTALLTLPALWALTLIHPRPTLAEAAVPVPTARAMTLGRLFSDHRLIVFCVCAALFQLANAALLQLVGGAETARNGADATLVIAACIVVPQVLVALLSPWVGRAADRLGRRRLLLLGFAVLPVRAAVFALTASAWVIVPVQALDGISGAVLGVLVPLIAADIAIGSGRFNLCLGAIGLAGGVGATLSTALAGWIADAHGLAAAFIALGVVGAAGTALVALGMPETRRATTM